MPAERVVLAIVTDPSGAPALLKMAERVSGQTVHFVAMRPDGCLALRARGAAEAGVMRDYLARVQREAIDTTALSWARSWFRSGADLQVAPSMHDGLELGELSEFDLTFELVEATALLQETHACFETLRPQEILLADDGSLGGEVARRLAEAGGIPVRCVSARRTPSVHPHRIWRALMEAALRAMVRPWARLRWRRAPERPVILFSYPKRLHNLLPHLKGRYRFAFEQLSPGEQWRLMRRGFQVATVDQLLGAGSLRRARQSGRRMAHVCRLRWKALERNHRWQERFFCDGLDAWPAVRVPLERTVRSVFPELARHMQATEDFIQQERPVLYLTANQRAPLARTSIAVCRRHGVQSLSLQNGATGPRGLPFSFVPVTADVMAVWGDISRDWLIGLGVPPHRVVVTGAPMLDHYAERPAVDGSGRQLTVLFLGQPYGRHRSFIGYDLTFREMDTVYRSLFQAMKELPETVLVVKPHPNDRYAGLCGQVARQSGAAPFECWRGGMEDALSRADIVITLWSTGGFEAMLLGKPVLTINFSHGEDWVPYAREGAAVAVRHPDELAQAIRPLLAEGRQRDELQAAQQRFIGRYGFSADGGSGRRVVALIERLISHQGPTAGAERIDVAAALEPVA